MTQTRKTDFEDGTSGSAYTLDTLANGSGSVCSTTVAAHGTKCVKELGSGSYQYVQASLPSAASTFRVRYALAQNTALTANATDLQLYADTTSFAGTNRALQVFRSSANKFLIQDSTGTTLKTFTTSIPTDGSFLVLELQVVCGTSANATINARLYTSAAPATILETFSTTTATTTATIQSAHLGKVTSGAFTPSTGTTYHDDFWVDDVSSGWIGPVEHLIPDPVGITDAAARTIAAKRTPADPVGLLDVATRTVAMSRTIPDAIGISDTAALKRTSAPVTTQVRATDFEDGTNGSTYTFDTQANGSGLAATNTGQAFGSLCGKAVGSGSYQYDQANLPVPSSTFRVRFYFATDTAVTAAATITQLYSDTTSFGSTNRALQVFYSGGKFLVQDSTGATLRTFTNTIPTDGSYVVLELQGVCGTSGNATVNGKMYAAADPTTILDSFSTTTATTTATIQSCHLGKVTSGAYTPSTGANRFDGWQFDDGTGGWIGPYVGALGAVSVGITDAVARTIAVTRPVPDLVGITDQPTVRRAKLIADLVGVTDTASSTASTAHMIADAIGILDTPAGQAWTLAIALDPDAIGVTDHATPAVGGRRAPADVVGILDTAGSGRGKTVADIVGIVDAAAVKQLRSVANLLGLTDASVAVQALKRAPADAVGITDQVVRNASIRRTAADVIGLVDVAALAASANRAAADLLGISDHAATVVSHVAAVADLVGISDGRIVTLKPLVAATASDFVGITDAVTRALGAARSPADVVGILDAVVRGRVIGVTASVGLQDFATAALMLRRTTNDLVGIGDNTVVGQQLRRLIADLIAITGNAAAVEHRLRGFRVGRPSARWRAGAPTR